MNHYEIIKKLIGPVTSVGSSHVDRDRLKNLKKTIDLADKLLDDIYQASLSRTRQELSMKAIGDMAHDYLTALDYE